MAMYHLHVRFVKRSEGRSSVAAAAYRAGEKLRDDFRGETFDFRHKVGQVQHQQVLLPEAVPEWLADRQTLWGTVEDTLNHKNGQPAFEVEVALPRELSHEQRVALAQDFAQREFVDQGLIVDLCLHMAEASDGGEHPHAHMLITTRRWNEEGAMTKAARDLQDNPQLLKRVYALEEAGKVEEAYSAARGTHLAGWRERWADDTNAMLEAFDHSDRVDHRTLAEQATAREPAPNVGIGFYGRLREFQGHMAERIDHWKEVGFRNAMREQMERFRETSRDLQADFMAHAREYAPQTYPELQQELPEQGIEHER